MSTPSPIQARLERDLYRQCLDLALTEDPAPLLEETLRLLRERVGAARGYIELADLGSATGQIWWADAGVEEDERRAIRDRISHGVIASAIETGCTVRSDDATHDERFATRQSVVVEQIGPVLCVPLQATGISGVIYLQNTASVAPFDEDDQSCVETVARYVSALAARSLELIRARDRDDPTQEIRESLDATGVIGRSPALAQLLKRAAVVASMESNVLITGPSGTGKSLFAALLHRNSRRRDKAFVELNCANLPASLLESELFGADRGAHSGVAHRGVEGKVAAAEGGTLFLDEIGDLDPQVQAKLLQLLQSKQYYRLGSSTALHADVRIIAATNRDLEAALDEGTFREDLYYRLRGVQLVVPPLTQRREDIPALANHLCAQICDDAGLPPMRLSAGAIAALTYADWPGNIRQLRNALDDAFVNARMDGSTTVHEHHIFGRDADASADGPETFVRARERMERSYLQQALQQRDWNVAQTARELEMSRSHLNALIRRYGLARE